MNATIASIRLLRVAGSIETHATVPSAVAVRPEAHRTRVGFTLHRCGADGRRAYGRESSQRAAPTGAWRNRQTLDTCFTQTAFFHAVLPA